MDALRTILVAALILAPTSAAQTTNRLEVTSQGRIVRPDASRSPAGRMQLETTLRRNGFVEFWRTIRVVQDGRRSAVEFEVPAAGLWATDAGRVVSLSDHCSNVAPRTLQVLDPDGAPFLTRRVSGVTDPTLSPDGRTFAFRHRGGVAMIDLVTGDETSQPRFEAFALGRGGAIAGVVDGSLEVVAQDGSRRVATLDFRARKLAFDGDDVLVLGARALTRFDAHTMRPSIDLRATEPAELMDLVVDARGTFVGERSTNGTSSTGRLLRPHGSAFTVVGGTQVPMVPHVDAAPIGGIPWPLSPDTQHPIGNTYAEYQRYGGSPYMHPGIDVMGAPNEAVYAVADGEVKAVLTTSAQYHWRVAIANEPGPGHSEGYLYAHLVESTITVQPGDQVVAGQYLGDLVPWPVADFTHIHFARVEDTGNVWLGDWLNVDNPHLDLPGRTESSAPVFEPAIGSDMFAFCRNDTSNYLSPNALRGEVDIIAHVGDTVASAWVCTVQTIRYSIHPVGAPGSPVVDDKLAVEFDMPLDTYAGGPVDPFLVDLLFKEDSTCDTDGDYGSREFFHVITNSDGDAVYEASDVQEAWDTRSVPNGAYVVSVTATDAAGNSATAAMTVTVSNP